MFRPALPLDLSCYNIPVKKSFAFLFLLLLTIGLTGCGIPTKEVSITTPQLHIKYSVVQGLADKAIQDKANKLIYSTVFKLRDDNASALKDHKKDYSYYVQYRTAFNRKNILSIRLDECLAIPYYAHPFNSVNAVTINTKDGSTYKLKDLFAVPGWQMYLNVILKDDIDELARKNRVPKLEEFISVDGEQAFYLSDRGLVIYWQGARYFSRSFGPLEVTIKYSAIRDLMKKELGL
jgi:Deacetylase PdaC